MDYAFNTKRYFLQMYRLVSYVHRVGMSVHLVNAVMINAENNDLWFMWI